MMARPGSCLTTGLAPRLAAEKGDKAGVLISSGAPQLAGRAFGLHAEDPRFNP